jgi:hypothetical protein
MPDMTYTWKESLSICMVCMHTEISKHYNFIDCNSRIVDGRILWATVQIFSDGYSGTAKLPYHSATAGFVSVLHKH